MYLQIQGPSDNDLLQNSTRRPSRQESPRGEGVGLLHQNTSMSDAKGAREKMFGLSFCLFSPPSYCCIVFFFVCVCVCVCGGGGED